MQTKIFLGYLGFLPFAALTILPWILGETYEEISFQLLVVYGGIIISFLSGCGGPNPSGRPAVVFRSEPRRLGQNWSQRGWRSMVFRSVMLVFVRANFV